MACPKRTSQVVPSAILSWPGYGIWFFWQLGVLQYLEDTFDLSSCIMVGSSAGALLSVLAACNIKPQAALDLAHQLCVQHGVFQRPLGLIGVWGGLVKQWLQELLPPDAAERCSGGHVRIVLTTFPYLTRQVVSDFKDRDDLIQCALASAHLPYILDWQLCATWQDQHCVDGSMLYILTRRCSALKPGGSSNTPLLLFDPLSDWSLLNPLNLLRCISLCGKESAQQMLEQGVDYARRVHAGGGFAALAPRKPIPQQQQQQQQQQQEVAHHLSLLGLDADAQDAQAVHVASIPPPKDCRCSSTQCSCGVGSAAVDAEMLVAADTDVSYHAGDGDCIAEGIKGQQVPVAATVIHLTASSQH